VGYGRPQGTGANSGTVAQSGGCCG